MPTRNPIIPGGSRRILRALHTEMKEKKLIQEQQIAPYPDSGVHSNSSSSEVSDVINDLDTSPSSKTRFKAMPQEIVQSDSSTCADSDDTDAERETHDDDNTSSDDDVKNNHHYGYAQHHRPAWTSRQKMDAKSAELKRLHGKMREVKVQPLDRAGGDGFKRRMEEICLSEKEKYQLREGYKKFALNREQQQIAGTSFSSKPSAFTKVNNAQEIENAESEDDDLQFPLEEVANGNKELMTIGEARRHEREKKQKTKSKKKIVAETKLLVSEAKLSEFEAKLAARQAKIDERHAKLCRKRAVLKRAEERLQNLEARLDEDEEDHRERERRIRNRERRVRQEEAGLQIKESSLKKREAHVTESIDGIENRRRLVEEKEEMLDAMEDIMKKRENLHKSDERSKVGKAVGSLGRKILRNGRHTETSPKSNNIQEEQDENHHEKTPRSRQDRMSTGSYHRQPSAPIPTPRKSVTKQSSRARSNSLNSDDDVKMARKPATTTGSLPRFKGQKAVMGLWL